MRVLEADKRFVDERRFARFHKLRTDVVLHRHKVFGIFCFRFGAQDPVQSLDPLFRRDLFEQRFLKCLRGVPFLQVHRVAIATVATDDHVYHGIFIDTRFQAALGEDLLHPLDHLRHANRIVASNDFEQPGRFGRHFVKTRNALAANVDFAGIARIINLDPGIEQSVIHADDLKPEQREDAFFAGTVDEVAIHLVIVVVADAKRTDALFRRKIHRVLHAFKNGKVRRQMNVSVHARRRLRAVALPGQRTYLIRRSQLAQDVQRFGDLLAHLWFLRRRSSRIGTRTRKQQRNDSRLNSEP